VSNGNIEKIERLSFDSAPSRARRIVHHGDIIWSTVRPNLRAYALVIDPPSDLIVSTGFAVITPSEIPFSYLYLAVTTNDFVGYLSNRTTGAAYPAVNTNDFEEARVLLPSKPLLDYFNGMVEPILLLTNSVRNMNETLGKTRDLLLPKLSSGKIDVSDMDIDTGAADE
jgi:type I restriction enzyme S subunit